MIKCELRPDIPLSDWKVLEETFASCQNLVKTLRPVSLIDLTSESLGKDK